MGEDGDSGRGNGKLCTVLQCGVRALGIFTVSDSMVSNEEMSAEERQNGFTNMMKVALGVAVRL